MVQTKFTFSSSDVEPKPEEFVLHVYPKNETVKRKCKECEETTEKSAVMILAATQDASKMSATKTIYTCKRCGGIVVQ